MSESSEESTQESRQGNEALQRARKARRWTQEDAAAQIGCSVDALQGWESGPVTTPQKKWRVKLCEVYQSTPEDLQLFPSPRTSRKKASRKNAKHSAPEIPVLASAVPEEAGDLSAGDLATPAVVSLDLQCPSSFRQIVN